MKSSYDRRFFRMLGVMALAGVLCGAGAAWADVTPIWTNYDFFGGGGNPVVATQGSNTFVATVNNSGTANSSTVLMFDAHGNLVGNPMDWALSGGQVTAIAVSGSMVYVAGYTGVAGSGNEKIFVYAFKALSKMAKGGKIGLQPSWNTLSPSPVPDAGLYPIGIKALGSKIVLFYNEYSTGAVHGTIMGINPKDGTKTWASPMQGPTDVSGQVNAIAMKGSQVAAAGTTQNASGHYFTVVIYSATSGNYVNSKTIAEGSSSTPNEALAVSWVGSYLAAVGRTGVKGFFWGLKFSKNTLTQVWTDEAYEGGDTFMNAVTISGSNAYAAGYGNGLGFVRAYGLAPGTPKHPGGDIWSDSSLPGSINTTGLTVGKNRVYMSGYVSSGGTYWLVKAYDSKSGDSPWDQSFTLSGGSDSRALGIAMGAQAVIAVGRCYDGKFYKCGV
jgi:hypothetical protein